MGKTKTLPVDRLFSTVQRNLEKANYKQGLKDAKVCYRQAATPEHRRYLEIAHIARAQELQRNRDRDACRGVMDSLLALGVREPSVQESLPDVLIWLGMLDRLPAGQREISDADRARLEVKIADQAVLHVGGTQPASAAMREQANRVRQAIEALYQGDDDDAPALGYLHDIPRDSPLADWKLFVRGLAAYYRQDGETMRANWSRLNPDRAARKIAGALTAMAEGKRDAKADPVTGRAITVIEREISQQSTLTLMATLQSRAAEGDWDRAFQSLRGLESGLRRLDPALSRRLVRCLCQQLISDGQVVALDHLSRLVEPLPWDPHWNRAKAMVRRVSKSAPPGEDLPYWRDYIDDLAEVAGITLAQRDLARGLVWQHMAREHRAEAESLRDCPCGDPHTDEVARAEQNTLAALESSLRCVPAHLPTYQELADFHASFGRSDQAADAHRRALEHLPDHFETLVLLAAHHLKRDEPQLAQPYAQRARQAKPLDPKAAELVWVTHVAAAREYARQGQFDRGRAEHQAADALLPDRSGNYDTLARQAALEIKAGRAEEAQRLLTAAQESLDEPMPLWLFMAVEAERIGLPNTEVSLYDRRWTEALKQRVCASTARRMCELLHALLLSKGKYLPRRDHIQQLVDYLRRGKRVKWREPELRQVCAFLLRTDEPELLRTMADRGVKRFPQCALYHALAGIDESIRGRGFFKMRRVRRSLETALRLGKDSQDPLDLELLGSIKRKMAMLDRADFIHRMPHVDAEDFDEDDDEYDEYEDEFAGPASWDEAEDIDFEPPPGATPDEIFKKFAEICDRFGIDPQQFFDDVGSAPDAPPRFRAWVKKIAKGRPSRRRTS